VHPCIISRIFHQLAVPQPVVLFNSNFISQLFDRLGQLSLNFCCFLGLHSSPHQRALSLVRGSHLLSGPGGVPWLWDQRAVPSSRTAAEGGRKSGRKECEEQSKKERARWQESDAGNFSFSLSHRTIYSSLLLLSFFLFLTLLLVFPFSLVDCVFHSPPCLFFSPLFLHSLSIPLPIFSDRSIFPISLCHFLSSDRTFFTLSVLSFSLVVLTFSYCLCQSFLVIFYHSLAFPSHNHFLCLFFHWIHFKWCNL